ncbi:MAG: dephospho-CoA kinase, partial [Actinomycetota bacterium]
TSYSYARWYVLSVLLIALTGGIGSGKSTASGLLVERGAVLIDADGVNRELQAAGGKAFQAMVDMFGPSVVGANGELDRPAIAAIVFNDEEARRKLNALMHPMIGLEILERIQANAETDNVVVLDIPLLGMSGNTYETAGLVVVDCPVEVAVDRLVTGPRAMDRADATARIAAQISREERLALADFVIDNSGTPDDLSLAVDECWAWIAALRR